MYGVNMRKQLEFDGYVLLWHEVVPLAEDADQEDCVDQEIEDEDELDHLFFLRFLFDF